MVQRYRDNFPAIGDYPYFVATAPRFSGRVTVRALRVAVYVTSGAESDKLAALMRAVDSMGFEVYGIGRSDIDQGRLTRSNFDVFILPAGEDGSKDGYASPADGLNTANILNNIRAFVSSGGGFIGVCAGSFYASDQIEWEGFDYNYPLDLFSGWDRGPLDDIAEWPDYGLSLVNVSDPFIATVIISPPRR